MGRDAGFTVCSGDRRIERKNSEARRCAAEVSTKLVRMSFTAIQRLCCHGTQAQLTLEERAIATASLK